MFEVDRIYCSDITGFGVRPFPDLVFEVDRILQCKGNDNTAREEILDLFVLNHYGEGKRAVGR